MNISHEQSIVPASRWSAQDRYHPTFVVEVGLSQSLESLRGDMQWWFRALQDSVKVVLLAKLYDSVRVIRLEKYVRDTSQTRTGALNTRNMPQPPPQLAQVVTITTSTVTPDEPAGYTVVGGPLVLEFELLFLRSLNSAAGEKDILYSPADLEDTA
ncbi:MAG: hypothetical protein SEPTF4163_003128 [Sporothrix epigloea]